MKQAIALALTLAVVPGIATLAAAGDETVTLEGAVMCAKCTLEKEGASECQDVLVVETDGVKDEYYIVKNEVADSFGHSCQSTASARATGTLADRDGKSWITASVMKKLS